MKTILFVNDSYFSYLLSKPIIEKHFKDIKLIVISSKIKGSKSNIFSIYQKTYLKYFVFRSFVEILSIINNYVGKNTVLSLAAKYNIRAALTHNVSELYSNFKENDIAIAFNFDQILKPNIINLFPKGIINIHASRLPLDRGISPALWAFARGDKDIWTTIYEIDSGIDTGKIYTQYSVAVNDDESYFSLYKKICINGGKNLLKTYELIEHGQLEPKAQDNLQQEIYHSWPDIHHKKQMQVNNKKFISLTDVLRMNNQ